MSKKVEIAVGGKKLAVSNLGKVLYPKVGFTKGEVIDYYIRISPVLLPHLKNRPITLKRANIRATLSRACQRLCAKARC